MIISASSKKSTSNQFKNKKMYLCISKLMGDGLWGLLICWPQVFIKDTGYFQTALPGTLQISVQIPMHLEQLPAASTAVCAFEQTGWFLQLTMQHHHQNSLFFSLPLGDQSPEPELPHSWVWDSASPMRVGVLVHSYSCIKMMTYKQHFPSFEVLKIQYQEASSCGVHWGFSLISVVAT